MSNPEITIAGCGYIGKRLARQLNRKNIAVSTYVSSEHSRQACAALGVPCTVFDLDSPQHDMDVDRHRLLYTIPPAGNAQTDPRMTHFLQAIECHRPEKFVLISTTGVYGDCQGAWIDERTTLRPTAARAKRRVDAERQVQRYCEQHDIALVILRVAGIYGPGKIPIARLERGEPVVDPAESPLTNRIHADDLVNICQQALLDEAITGIYNVTDGHPGTMYEYFTGIAEVLKLPAPPVISMAEARQQLSEGMLSYMSESRRIDNSKLLHDFDLVLQYPNLQQGLKRIS